MSLNSQIDLITREYAGAYKGIVLAKTDKEVKRLKSVLADIDTLRNTMMANKGMPDKEVLPAAIKKIASKDKGQAERIVGLLKLDKSLLGNSKKVEKFNPYHDEIGRFTFAPAFSLTLHHDNFSSRPDKPQIGRINKNTIAILTIGDNEIPINASNSAKDIIEEHGGLESAMHDVEATLSEVKVEDLDGITQLILTDNSESLFGAKGYYIQSGSPIISVNVERTYAENGNMTGATLKHEIGHAGWNSLTPEQRVRYAELVNHPNPELFRAGTGYESTIGASDAVRARSNAYRDIPVKATTDYGTNNLGESWAETYTFIDWHTGSTNPSIFSDLPSDDPDLTFSASDLDDMLGEVSIWR